MSQRSMYRKAVVQMSERRRAMRIPVLFLVRATLIGSCCYAVATGNLIIAAIMLGITWIVLEIIIFTFIIALGQPASPPLVRRGPNDLN